MRHTIFLMVLLITAAGCSQDNTQSKNDLKPSETLKRVKSSELAKLILKPERAALKTSQDPFKPIRGATTFTPIAYNRQGSQSIQEFRFLGVATVGNEYVAYLKKGTERGTYRQDDKVNDFTIRKIEPDKVILTNGAQTITLRRGVLN